MAHAARAGTADDPFHVPGWMHAAGALVTRWPRLWIAAGNLETRLLAAELPRAAARAPIYIAGLARSGSTILLELLARHPEVATHRYRDFPALFTPYWWNRWLDYVPRPPERPRERAHADRLPVTSESPEALEEMLWAAFFPAAHHPQRCQVLDGQTEAPRFERFYRGHIAKLLYLRGGSRYCAKGNYNVSRLGYLYHLFPDARFIVPVRDPIWHIASLMKQHRLFTAAQQRRPRARAHLRRAGHFEFGLDRRAIDVGDGQAAAVHACWQAGREVEGWARYWASLYGHVLQRLDARGPLREAVLIVRYEDLCRAPQEWMGRILAHAGLHPASGVLQEARRRLAAPDYYRPTFSAAERRLIAALTAPAARRLGYGAAME